MKKKNSSNFRYGTVLVVPVKKIVDLVGRLILSLGRASRGMSCAFHVQLPTA